MQDRLNSIDALRFVAFAGVVAIHMNSGQATLLLGEVGRFAVPFYFAVAGYFLASAGDWLAWPRVQRFALRIAPIYIFWFVVYQGAAWLIDGWFSERPVQVPEQPAWLAILWTGDVAIHLWFLPALLASVSLTIVAARWGLEVLVASAVAVFIAVLLSGTYRFLVLEPGTFEWGSYFGNLYGYLLVVCGYVVARKDWRLSLGLGLGLFMGSLLASIAELYLLWRVLPSGSEVGLPAIRVTTPMLAISSLLMALAVPDGRAVAFLASLGRYALGMYAVHLLFVWLIERSTVLTDVSALVAIPVVIVLSAAVARALGATPLHRLVR